MPSHGHSYATQCSRILDMAETSYEFRYRYESWVQFVSRPVPPRVDLKPLAISLSEKEGEPWIFYGVEEIVPSLHRKDGYASRIPPETFRHEVEDFLRSAPSAWDPFDPR